MTVYVDDINIFGLDDDRILNIKTRLTNQYPLPSVSAYLRTAQRSDSLHDYVSYPSTRHR